jgi:hypothetical protein
MVLYLKLKKLMRMRIYMFVKNWFKLILMIMLVFQYNSQESDKQVKAVKKKIEKLKLRSHLNGIWMRIGKKSENKGITLYD